MSILSQNPSKSHLAVRAGQPNVQLHHLMNRSGCVHFFRQLPLISHWFLHGIEATTLILNFWSLGSNQLERAQNITEYHRTVSGCIWWNWWNNSHSLKVASGNVAIRPCSSWNRDLLDLQTPQHWSTALEHCHGESPSNLAKAGVGVNGAINYPFFVDNKTYSKPPTRFWLLGKVLLLFKSLQKLSQTDVLKSQFYLAANGQSVWAMKNTKDLIPLYILYRLDRC